MILFNKVSNYNLRKIKFTRTLDFTIWYRNMILKKNSKQVSLFYFSTAEEQSETAKYFPLFNFSMVVTFRETITKVNVWGLVDLLYLTWSYLVSPWCVKTLLQKNQQNLVWVTMTYFLTQIEKYKRKTYV